MVHGGRRRLAATVGPLAVAGVAALLFLLLAPSAADLAAHTYRAELFRREGLSLWNGNWYGGHHLPGYSVLFPAVSALLGPRWAGALSAVAVAVLLAALIRSRWGEDGWLGALWAGLVTLVLVGTARFAFAFGLVPALGALLALQRGRRPVAFVLALLTPLASPVAGLFLAIAGAALVVAGPRRRDGVALAALALAPVLVLSVAFPEGGAQPFVFSSFWPVALLAVLAFVLLHKEERVLRAGVAIYGLVALVLFLVPNPAGGNVARLGPLVAGPVAAAALLRTRPRVLAALAVPLLAWQVLAPIRDVSAQAGDPSVHAGFYSGLLRFLTSRPGPPARVEIPFTRTHWEAAWVAPHVELARGWERQLDRRYDALFYRAYSVDDYRRWLRGLAVRWVAVPRGVRFDYTGEREAALVLAGLPFLRPVWHDARWTVWEVRRPGPVVRGPARLAALGPDELRLVAARAGRVRLAVRFTPYWELAEGHGCVRRTPDGWTELRLRTAGPVRLVTSFALGRVRATSPRCR